MYVGPIAKSTRDLTLFTKALLTNEFMYEKDFYLMPSPWNDSLFLVPSKTTVAIFPESAFFDLTKGQKRIMLEAINGLTLQGVKIIPFDYEKSYELVSAFLNIASVLAEAFIDEFKDDFLGGES